ncbi:ABC-three component system middle component 1 [Streptococcus equi]|uniref:ABC-three component system middle component 1 n=1 Tax=Streptococcus equi TaxID=1336 RepID=UPI0013F69704|nr:ABC-three component system middle component 1 [Streptococcus equi]
MNDFLHMMMESEGYVLSKQSSLEIFKNDYEFYIFEHFKIEELKDFFKSEKLDCLISEFQKLDDDKVKKNTSLFVLVKVNNIQEAHKQYLNKIMTIEGDEYYFRKYVIFYTEDGLSKIEPNTQFLLDYIQSDDSKNKSLFDKFENNMFFDDSYFIAMQLIIKLPFISLPHSDARFETIEDRIKSRMETSELVKQEQQVNEILKLFNNDNISEQLKDVDILDSLRKILGD